MAFSENEELPILNTADMDFMVSSQASIWFRNTSAENGSNGMDRDW